MEVDQAGDLLWWQRASSITPPCESYSTGQVLGQGTAVPAGAWMGLQSHDWTVDFVWCPICNACEAQDTRSGQPNTLAGARVGHCAAGQSLSRGLRLLSRWPLHCVRTVAQAMLRACGTHMC